MKQVFREQFEKLAKAIIFCDAERVKELCNSDWFTDNRPDCKYRVCRNSDFDSEGTNLLDVIHAWKALLSSECIRKINLPIKSIEIKTMLVRAVATQHAIEEIFKIQETTVNNHNDIVPIGLKYDRSYIYRYHEGVCHINNLLAQALAERDVTFFETLLEIGANPWAIYKKTGKNFWEIIITELNKHLQNIFAEMERGNDLNLKKVVSCLIQTNNILDFYKVLTKFYPNSEDQSLLMSTHPRIIFLIKDAFRIDPRAIEISFNRSDRKINIIPDTKSSEKISAEDLEWLFEEETFEELRNVEIQDTEMIILDGERYELLAIDDQGRFTFIECDMEEISQVPIMQYLKGLIPNNHGEDFESFL